MPPHFQDTKKPEPFIYGLKPVAFWLFPCNIINAIVYIDRHFTILSKHTICSAQKRKPLILGRGFLFWRPENAALSRIFMTLLMCFAIICSLLCFSFIGIRHLFFILFQKSLQLVILLDFFQINLFKQLAIIFTS